MISLRDGKANSNSCCNGNQCEPHVVISVSERKSDNNAAHIERVSEWTINCESMIYMMQHEMSRWEAYKSVCKRFNPPRRMLTWWSTQWWREIDRQTLPFTWNSRLMLSCPWSLHNPQCIGRFVLWCVLCEDGHINWFARGDMMLTGKRLSSNLKAGCCRATGL